MFIENEEGVRAWLMSNLVLKDRLDLLVYCHRLATQERPATLPLRGHNYLHKNAIAHWAQHAAGRYGLQAPQRNTSADSGPANALGKQANNSPLFHPGSSSSSSVISDAGEGREARIGTSQSPVGDSGESSAFCIQVGIQSRSQMNSHQWSQMRGGRLILRRTRYRSAWFIPISKIWTLSVCARNRVWLPVSASG